MLPAQGTEREGRGGFRSREGGGKGSKIYFGDEMAEKRN